MGTQIPYHSTNCTLFFTKWTVSKNNYICFEWLWRCNMEKLLCPYLLKILLKVLTFVEWLSVSIPQTMKLVSVSWVMFSSILLANHCSFYWHFWEGPNRIRNQTFQVWNQKSKKYLPLSAPTYSWPLILYTLFSAHLRNCHDTFLWNFVFLVEYFNIF